jgi:enamine deaminase RidA (YjgF/YER057c/UK114 family)
MMTPRRFVPFGTHWAMGIDVPYSFGVVDGGQFWSCGQCPLDLEVNVRAPGDLEAQLKIVAGYIRDQFTPHGVPPSRLSKLVAYIVGDASDLDMTRRVLGEALGAAPLILAVGVPHFYYPGMRVEIDVYGVAEGARSDLAYRLVSSRPESRPSQHILTTRLYVSSGAQAVARQWAEAFGHDSGAAILATLPSDTLALADVVEVPGPIARSEIVDTETGIRVVKRQAGRYLTLLGRSTRPGRLVPEQTQAIMEAHAGALHAEALDFTDVVKQQTHYVGSSAAEDLYANMRIRNSYYSKPGPASTGLAVHGFADPATGITIELLAVRR